MEPKFPEDSVGSMNDTILLGPCRTKIFENQDGPDEYAVLT